MPRLPKIERKSREIINLGVLGSQILEEEHSQVQSTHNPATNEICKEMAQMRTELGLVLKHVTGVQKR